MAPFTHFQMCQRKIHSSLLHVCSAVLYNYCALIKYKKDNTQHNKTPYIQNYINNTSYMLHMLLIIDLCKPWSFI